MHFPGVARRFTRSIFLWGAAAFLAEAVYQQLNRYQPHRSGLWFFGLLPLPLMLGFIVSLVRTIWKMDELQKRISIESAFIAFAAALAISLAFAGLDRMGWYKAAWDDVIDFMLFTWACAYIFYSVKYR